MAPSSPTVTLAGGPVESSSYVGGTSPTWYFKISGTSGTTYNMDAKGNFIVSDTEPTGEYGLIWYDTSTTPNIVRF